MYHRILMTIHPLNRYPNSRSYEQQPIQVTMYEFFNVLQYHHRTLVPYPVSPDTL
jgi:hypothetical protein